MMMSVFCPTNRPVHVMISRHGDGQLIASAMERFNLRAVRGSSRKGASTVAAAALKILEEGSNLAITPDGPRGPFQVAASGATALAAKTGIPILPVSFSAKNHTRFGSWDKFMLVWPFTKIILQVGEPIFVSGDKENTEIVRKELEAILIQLTETADSTWQKGEH